jgi:3',5'-cyclic-AMP phosphodiesterase
MPVHLAPISRRRFLARSLATGAGLVLSPELLAASRSADENSWALLSDIHLAADRMAATNGMTVAVQFVKAVRALLALPKRPAGMLITGDLAYSSGEKGDYAVVGELLELLRHDGLPIHLVLGNHDNRDRFWEAFPEEKAAQRPLADRQVALLRTPRANWFVLDSLETTLATPGLLGREELDWLAKSLDANRTKPALVVVHHNPALNGGNMGLKDTAPFLEVIRPRKQVKAYIYGHTHAWKVEQDSSGIHFINLPAVGYAFNKEEPCGWALANLEPNGMRLELRCIDPTHKAHGEVKNLPWRA